MKIGELAALAGCETETIRFYEKQGLLAAPARTASGYRTYQQRHLEDLQFIRHCRAFDMSLSLVRQLLKFREAPSQPCGHVASYPFAMGCDAIGLLATIMGGGVHPQSISSGAQVFRPEDADDLLRELHTAEVGDDG